MPQCPSVCPSVTFRSLGAVITLDGISKIISPPNSDKVVTWRFMRTSADFARLHYFEGTHILGASRGGPCDSVASCYLMNALNGYVYGLQIFPIHSRVHPNKSPLTISSKRERAWAYPRTAQICWVFPIISGMGNATNFKFCRHIHRIDREKSPLKISR